MTDIKYMNLNEFRDNGYLQEVNRQFFHPRGLALEIRCDENNSIILGGIWDYRNDPEGVQYTPDVLETEIAKDKARTVQAELDKRAETRMKKFGYIIQPINID